MIAAWRVPQEEKKQEYIDREAALESICFNCFEHSMEDNNFCGIPCDDYERISKLPAADVREVKRGKWKKQLKANGWNEWYDCTCSCCGTVFNDFDPSNYCPNCGADMREES